MRIVSSIPDNIIAEFAYEQYCTSVFPISDVVVSYIEKNISDNTILLFSGSPNLPYDGLCIEPSMFSNIKINWKKHTIFIDPKNKSLLYYVIKKNADKQLLILNSNIFLGYRLWEDILVDITALSHIVKKFLITIPITRLDFNRLKFTNAEIAHKLGGVFVEDTIVICQ